MKTVIFCIVILLLACAIGTIIFLFVHKDKCPFCGSTNVVLQKFEGNYNYGRWHMLCKDCLKEFTIDGFKIKK